jgi:hypothetical protein
MGSTASIRTCYNCKLVDGEEPQSLQLSRLKARQGRDAKEKVVERAQDYNGKGVLFQPHHPKTVLRGGAMQQHKARAVVSAALICTGLLRRSGLESQPTSTKSVQASNANSSSLNAMFKLVAMIFQQITRELSGSESEED